jgi:hypothetical protein
MLPCSQGKNAPPTFFAIAPKIVLVLVLVLVLVSASAWKALLTIHRSPFTVWRSPFTVHRLAESGSVKNGTKNRLRSGCPYGARWQTFRNTIWLKPVAKCPGGTMRS